MYSFKSRDYLNGPFSNIYLKQIIQNNRLVFVSLFISIYPAMEERTLSLIARCLEYLLKNVDNPDTEPNGDYAPTLSHLFFFHPLDFYQ